MTGWFCLGALKFFGVCLNTLLVVLKFESYRCFINFFSEQLCSS